MARRTKHQREADLLLIGKWYIQGWTQQQIADEINRVRGYNISQQSISNDIDTLHDRWQEETALALDHHKAQELARIDELEREYWAQYEASKDDKEVTTRKLAGVGREQSGTLTTRTETRTGDPSYLRGVERCIELRTKLLGLEAPKRTELSGKDGGAIEYTVSFPPLPDDTLADILTDDDD